MTKCGITDTNDQLAAFHGRYPQASPKFKLRPASSLFLCGNFLLQFPSPDRVAQLLPARAKRRSICSPLSARLAPLFSLLLLCHPARSGTHIQRVAGRAALIGVQRACRARGTRLAATGRPGHSCESEGRARVGQNLMMGIIQEAAAVSRELCQR